MRIVFSIPNIEWTHWGPHDKKQNAKKAINSLGILVHMGNVKPTEELYQTRIYLIGPGISKAHGRMALLLMRLGSPQNLPLQTADMDRHKQT